MSTEQREHYAHGYGTAINKALARRSAVREAAFFLPHLFEGMRLIDLGCGQGNITAGLAEAIAPGEAVGVDIEESQTEIARQNAERARLANLRFETGTAYELQFEDKSFDGVFIHTLLEHLTRPEDAIAEAMRVMKPGGVIGVRHGERGVYDALYPVTPSMAFIHSRWMKPLFADVGFDTLFGRKQERFLRAAGFRELETMVVANPSKGHIAATLADMLEDREQPLVRWGVISEQEYDDDALVSELVDGIREWVKNPEALWLPVMWWETVGWK